jgi:hypothetical protein
MAGGSKARELRKCEHHGKERMMEGRDREWRGSPLDVSESTMDPYGIREIVIEFDNGDEDILRPKQRDEFESYELHQLAAYVDSLAHSIRKGKKN